VSDVPYDPELYFEAEQINLSLRAFTHGYDVYAPTQSVLWHLYGHVAPLHWGDTRDHSAAEQRERRRLDVLLSGDPDTLGPYGLGPSRTRAEFERAAGIEFSQRFRVRCVEPVRFARKIELETSGIDPALRYDVWVFALLDDNGEELGRFDITDRAVLAGTSRGVTVDAELPRAPSHYLLWPHTVDGAFGDRFVIPLPADG
jgi:hypothetical protein